MAKPSRLLVYALFIVLGLVLLTDLGVATAIAQEAAAEGGGAAPTVTQPGFTDIVFRGGMVNLLVWLMIFACSFATVAFIVDGIISSGREKLLPAHVVMGVQQSIDEGDLGNAMAVCEQNPGPLSNILLAGFNNITEGFEIVQEAVSAATEMETERIMQRISYLNLCGQLAPMLGLLGTVTGMVRAFASLAGEAGAAKATALALSISTALWTTVAGLLISVPAILAYTLLKNFVTKLLLESEFKVLDMIKVFKNAELEDEEEEL